MSMMICCVLLQTTLGADAEASLAIEEQRRLREKIAAVNMQQQCLKEEEAKMSELSLQLEQDRLKVGGQMYSLSQVFDLLCSLLGMHGSLDTMYSCFSSDLIFHLLSTIPF